jgi:hypothetical protein
MQENGKGLMLVAGGSLGLGLVVATLLGYSGDPHLAGLGNLILVMVLLVCLPVLLAGYVLWDLGRSVARELPPVH